MNRHLVFGLLVGTAFAAHSLHAAISAKAYVQDGLIAQWDAVANNGVDANGNDIHANLTDTPFWREVVNGLEMKKYGTGNLTWGANYAQFPGTMSLTNGIPAVKAALQNKSMTIELLTRPASTWTRYAGYLQLGYGGAIRQLTFEQSDTKNTLSNGTVPESNQGAFARLQYAATKWLAADDIMLRYNTKQFFGKDVLVTITVDSSGAHVALNNGPIIHTNPGGGVNPKIDVVQVGGYSGTHLGSGARIYTVRIYNRILSDEERAWNAMLDEARFFTKGDCLMSVSNSLANTSIGAPVPAYGIFAQTNTAPVTATLVNGLGLNAAGNVYYTLAGYTHYSEGGSVIASGSGSSYGFSYSTNTMARSRLVWNIAVSNLLSVAMNNGSLGSIAGRSHDGFYLDSETATITAVPNEGCGFLRWTGDLPAGANELDPVLVLPMDRPRNVVARFYDGSLRARYSRLEFIESTGREWIDTGVKASGLHDFKAYIQPIACGAMDPGTTTKNSVFYPFFGGGDGAVDPVTGITNSYAVGVANIYGTNVYMRTYYHGDAATVSEYRNATSWKGSPGTYGSNGVQEPNLYRWDRSTSGKLVLSAGGYTMDKATYYHTPSDFVSTNNLYIFKANIEGLNQHPAIMRIWSFELYDNSTGAKLLDLVPAKNDDTGEAGLYDLLTETFFGNVSGEGGFIPGPLVRKEWMPKDDNTFSFGTELRIAGYAGGSTVLTNVPVLVRISESSVAGFHYSQCLADGSDLAFSSEVDFSNRIPCEIDEWNPEGESLVWVKVPVLSGTDTKFYMRWGRAVPAVNPAPSEVWGDYIGVWHMNGYSEPDGVRNSAFRSELCLTGHVANAVTVQDGGPVGKGVYSTGAVLQCRPWDSFPLAFRQYAGDGAGASQRIDNMPLSITVQLWARYDGTLVKWLPIAKVDYRIHWTAAEAAKDVWHRYGWTMEFSNAACTSMSAYYGKSGSLSASYCPSATGLTPRTWTHYTFSSDGYNTKLFKDGTKIASKTNGSECSANAESPLHLLGNSTAGGRADEVRVSRCAFSETRLAADYAMMTDPDFVVASAVTRLSGESLSVVGTPLQYASEYVPYGLHDSLSAGDVETNSAPEFVMLDGTGNYRAYCRGWDLYEVVDGDDVFVRASTNTTVAGESFTNAIVTVSGSMKLVWRWGEEYRVAATAEEGGSFSGTGWIPAGTIATVTAVPAEGYSFLCWTNGVAAGSKAISASQTYSPIGQPHVNLVAVFVPDSFVKPDWLYIPSLSLLADRKNGSWFFLGVTASGKNLYIPSSSSHVAPSAKESLDFTRTIADPSGAAWSLQKFTSSDYNMNLFGESSSSTKSSKVSQLILPESFTTSGSGCLQYFGQCTIFNFFGDVKSVNTRMFYNASKCQRIRFWHFPPNVPNDSVYTFVSCGAGDYKFRIEYPDYLENAWLNETNVGARYDYAYAMSASAKSTALTNYRSVFGSTAAEPAGYASLNFKTSEASPKRYGALVPFDPGTKAGKIRVGVMGLPFQVAKAAAMTPAYGYHEYDVGEPITIVAPPRITKYAGGTYLCKGYKLSSAPDVLNHYVPSFTMPGDEARNVGVTWVWIPFNGYKGVILMTR